MRFVQILLLSCLLFLSSCDIRPWSVLNRQEMADVLFDIHLAESIFQVYKPGYTKEEKQKVFDNIFAKYDISKETFDNSLKWYASHPDEFQLVYRSVLDKTNDFQEKVDDYYFHPNEKLSSLDSIDTFNIWLGRRRLIVPKLKNPKAVAKDLRVSYSNENDKYFFKNDTLDFRIKIRAISADSTIYRTGMFFTYTDGTADSILHYSYADSLVRNIHYSKIVPEDKSISTLEVVLIDSLRGINSIYIDTISLDKRYNKFKNRFEFNVLKSISNTRDSIREVESNLYKSKGNKVK